MVLQAAFPDPPPLPHSRRPSPPPQQRTTAVPNQFVPSWRRPIPSSEPLEPPPLPTPHARPLPSGLGHQAPLFRCHCAPRCIEFVKPRDHKALQWLGSRSQPLRARVVGSGPAGSGGGGGVSGGGDSTGRSVGGVDFDVDARVAYEFNLTGFYAELRQALEQNYESLIVANERAQAFLHVARDKCRGVDVARPEPYRPYYPSEHLEGRSFVPPPPLANAHAIAAAVVPPMIAGQRRRPSVQEIESRLRDHALAVAQAHTDGSLLPSHLRQSIEFESASSSSDAGAAESAPGSAASSLRLRQRVAADRARFTEEMKQQLMAKMSIHTQATQ